MIKHDLKYYSTEMIRMCCLPERRRRST